MFDIIAFDGDDTLWDNERIYQQAQDRFVELLSNNAQPDKTRQRLEIMEVQNIRYYGYGIKSYVLSMIETTIEISSGKVDGEIIRQIFTIAKEMLDTEVKLFEYAEQTLAILSQAHDLMLITKGDQFEQERKVHRSGLAKYFRYIEIVGDKNRETYQRIFNKYNLDPQRFLMIGNSIKSDILPVIQMGGKAIYIHYPGTWSHEMLTSDEIKGYEYIEMENLGQLSEYLNLSNPLG